METANYLTKATEHDSHISNSSFDRIHSSSGYCSSIAPRLLVNSHRFLVGLRIDDVDHNLVNAGGPLTNLECFNRKKGRAFNWMTIRGICNAIPEHRSIPLILQNKSEDSALWYIFDNAPRQIWSIDRRFK